MKKIFTLSALALAISACGDDPLSENSNAPNAAGTLVIDGSNKTGSTLTAILEDGDGYGENSVSYRWMVDGVAVSSTTKTYEVTGAVIGKKISVNAVYRDKNLTNEDVTSASTSKIVGPEAGNIAIEGGTFPGDELTALLLDGNGVDFGTVVYTWMAGSDVIGENLASYTLTDAELGKTVTVSATYLDQAEYEESVVSEPTGIIGEVAEDAPYHAGAQVAAITDTSTSVDGELRYKLESGLTQGKLTVALMYDVGETETATVNLFDAANSTGSLVAQLRLDEGTIKLRNGASSADYISLGSFIPGQWVEIEMTWNTSSATEAGTYTVSINGESQGSFTSQNPDFGVEVSSLAIQLADGGKEASTTLHVDGFTVYEDQVGEEDTHIFKDDYEAYALGTDLTVDDDTNVYDKNSSQAAVIVAPIVLEPEVPETGIPAERGQYASIIDSLTTDNGELRWKTGDIMETGKLRVSFFKQKDSKGEKGGIINEMDAYIGIYGDKTSSSNAITDLRIHGAYPWSDDKENGTYEVRNSDFMKRGGQQTIGSEWEGYSDYDSLAPEYQEGVKFPLDEWHVVELTWDASSDEGVIKMTLTIDGIPYGEYDSPATGLDEGPTEDGVNTFTFRFSDTSTLITDGSAFFVDDIRIFNNVAGNGDPVFSESFESYDVDTELNNTVGPNGTTYHDKTVDVTIVEDAE